MGFISPTCLLFALVLLLAVTDANGQRPPCPRGRGLVDGVCVDCPTGTFSQDATCIPCPPGQFNPRPRAPSCRICRPGSFASELATVRCQLCPRNSTALNYGSAECRASCLSGCPQCAPGFGFNRDTRTCQRCAADRISADYSATPCFPCSTGAVPNAQRTKCICPAGMLVQKLSAGVSCRKCFDGATSPDGEICRCEAGRIAVRSQNTFQHPELIECRCGLGMKSVNGTCESCTDEEIENNFECNVCETGSGVRNGRCRPCRGNSVQPVRGVRTCQPCADGLVATQDKTQCICAAGSGRDAEGKCVTCAAGSASTREGICERCRGSLISRRPGSSKCTSCPRGWTGNASNTRCSRRA